MPFSETVKNLDIVLKVFLRKEFYGLQTELQWTNLAVSYHSAIEHVLFALEEQEKVLKQSKEKLRAWAKKVLTPDSFDGLDFWLLQYHKMMTGEDHLRPGKPMLALYMETRFEAKCDDDYIQGIENLWSKYAVTAKAIEAERDAASAQLQAFMAELGYE